MPKSSVLLFRRQDALGKLFEGLGMPMSNAELTQIVDEADVDHDAPMVKPVQFSPFMVWFFH